MSLRPTMIRRHARRLLPAALAVALAAPWLSGQEKPILDAAPPRPEPPPGYVADPRLKAVSDILSKAADDEPVTDDDWEKVCIACGIHPSVKGFVRDLKTFPASSLVKLLAHPKLAVRLGALEILEEKAGDTLGFEPWEPDPAKNAEALKKWQQWAEAVKPRNEGGLLGSLVKNLFGSTGAGGPPKHVPLDPAKLRGYLVDVVSEQADRRERAIANLTASGMESVAAIETYLQETPQIPSGIRVRLKEAQYRIVIGTSLPSQAPLLARQIAYGPRDARLEAMGKLTRCGLKALPVLNDFLDDSDELVRESAVELMLQAGGPRVYELIDSRLKKETDDNVTHAALRNIRADSPTGAAILVRYMNHANEDLAVASMTALKVGESRAGASMLEKCFADPRWRVRVAAMEYAAKVRHSSARAAVLKALGDKDEFVRYAAVKAASDVGVADAKDVLTGLALKDDSMIGPVVEAFVRSQSPYPASLGDSLLKRPGESVLSAVRALSPARHDSAKPWQFVELRKLVAHPDPDVRAGVVRALATSMQDSSTRDIVRETLAKANDESREQILQVMHAGTFDFQDAAPEAVPDTDVFRQVLSEKTPNNRRLDEAYANLGALSPSERAAMSNVASASATPAGSKAFPGSRDSALGAMLLDWMHHSSSQSLRLEAAVTLLAGGNRAATAYLQNGLAARPAHERAAIAHAIYSASRLPDDDVLVPLFKGLLNDASPDIRSQAVTAGLGAKASGLNALVLEELLRDGTTLQPADVYGYRLENMLESTSGLKRLSDWAIQVLAEPKRTPALKVLALAILGDAHGASAKEAVTRSLTDGDQWVRRAAWRSHGKLDRASFERGLDRIVKDASAQVRENVAAFFTTGDHAFWEVRFTDLQHEEEQHPYRRNSSDTLRLLSEEGEAQLRKLENDPSPSVRLATMLALLSQGRSVPSWSLAATLEAMPDADERDRRLQFFLQENYRKIGSGYGVMLDYVQKKHFSNDTWQEMQQRFQLGTNDDKKETFTTFASLVKLEVPDKVHPTKQAEERSPRTERRHARVLLFYTPGCADCDRARDMLRSISRTQSIEVEEVNGDSTDGALRLEALGSRFGVDTALRGVSPAIFMQGGFLIKTDIDSGSLHALVNRTLASQTDPKWMDVDATLRDEAAKVVDARLDGLRLKDSIAAGLSDGWNRWMIVLITLLAAYLRRTRFRFRLAMALGLLVITQVVTCAVLALISTKWASALGPVAPLCTLARFCCIVGCVRCAWRSFRGKNVALTSLPPPLRLSNPEKRVRYAIILIGALIACFQMVLHVSPQLSNVLTALRMTRGWAVVHLIAYDMAYLIPVLAFFVLAITVSGSARIEALRSRFPKWAGFIGGAFYAVLLVQLLR